MTTLVGVRRLPSKVETLLDAAAARYDIVPELARAVAWTESRGNQTALGTSGERGVMQLMADTAKRLNVDPSDLEQNIDGGVRLLASLVKKYGVDAGLCAYNAGPRWATKVREQWPRTTQDYVRKVTARAAVERELMTGGRTAAGPFAEAEQTTPGALPPALPGSSQRQSSPPPSHGKGPGSDDT
jgi:soluble lytic murein transglycosylase-like protein